MRNGSDRLMQKMSRRLDLSSFRVYRCGPRCRLLSWASNFLRRTVASRQGELGEASDTLS